MSLPMIVPLPHSPLLQSWRDLKVQLQAEEDSGQQAPAGSGIVRQKVSDGRQQSIGLPPSLKPMNLLQYQIGSKPIACPSPPRPFIVCCFPLADQRV